MREGRGAGEAGALPPPTPALHYIFSTSHKNFVQVMPHEKEGSESPCIPGRGPSAPSPLGDPLPRSQAGCAQVWGCGSGVPSLALGDRPRGGLPAGAAPQGPSPVGALPELPFIQAGDPLGGGGRMGSVRSDHVGQQYACPWPQRPPVFALPLPRPPRGPLLPSRLATRNPCGCNSRLGACRAGWKEGTRGAGRGDREGPSLLPLHCGARGWGIQRSRPPRGGG